MATYTDNFNSYSSGQDLNGLGNWVKVLGRFTTSSGTMVYVDDYISSGESCYRYNSSVGNDQYAQVRIAATDTSGYHCYGVAARISSSAATYYAFYTDDNGSCYLVRSINGTVTELGNYSYNSTVSDVLRIECEGTTIRAKINNTTVISTTDSNITSGQVGIAGYLSDSVTGIDDFEGGDLGGGGTYIGINAKFIKVG